MRTLVVFLLCFLCSASTGFCKQLVVVCEQGAPFKFIGKNGPSGLSVDVTREAFARMGYSVRFEFMPWKRALHSVYVGKADAVMDAVYSDERSKFLHYPVLPIRSAEILFYVKKGDSRSFANKSLLAHNTRLGVGRGTCMGML